MARILILGGTSEATALAEALARRGADAVFSYAGRTGTPAAQPLPTRIGGFGGVAGLAAYLAAEKIGHVVDATHPFAAQMSRNAIAACTRAGVPLTVFERAPWQAGPGDEWRAVADIEAAAAALPGAPARVFLAIGRQNLPVFAAHPQHFYLLRLVDAPMGALPLPRCHAVIARGPFDRAGDLQLLRAHRIDIIVAKNSGGTGARAKLEAARDLGLPVVMIDRPALPPREIRHDLGDVLARLGHPARLGV